MHRIVVVDDHRLIRESLSALLDAEPGLHVVGSAGDGVEATRLVADLAPDLVLMDLSMPVMDGIAATRAIKAVTPEVRVLMLTFVNQRQLVREAMAAGADGFLVKDQSVAEILAGVRLVLAGGTPAPASHAVG